MKKRFLWIVCFVFIFTFIVTVQAADDDFESEEAFFKVEEEIASVSSKYAQKVSETPAILSVITREQLQDMGCRTVADALRFVPGIGVSIDELGGYNKVAIRGVRQWPNVLFMIDGQRMNDLYSGLALYDISIDYIEKIEIIRGPGSSIHGTGGFVGVISLTTNQNIPEGFTVKSEFGEDKTLRTSVNWSGKVQNWKTNFFAEIYQTDGQEHRLYGYPTSDNTNYSQGRTYPHLPIDYIGPGDDLTKVNTENNVTRATTLSDIGYTAEDKQKAILDYKMSKEDISMKFKYLYDSRGANIGLHGRKRPNTNLERSIYSAWLDKTNKINDNLTVISKFYFDQQNVENKMQTTADNPVVGNATDANKGKYQIIEYGARTFGTEFQANYNLKKNMIVSGVQFERLALIDYYFHTLVGANTFLSVLAQEDRSRTVMGAYLQDEYKPNQFLGFTAGLRYDKYSDFGNTTNPKIGAVYLFGKHFKKDYFKGLGLKVSYATAFRAPTFQELYDKTEANLVYGAVGNSDLKPEKIKTKEIALEYEYKMLRFKINYYTNEIEDQIGYFPGLLGQVQGSSNQYFNNSNLVKTKGYEIEARTTKYTFLKFLPDMWTWFNISKVKVEADAFKIGITPMSAVTRTELPQWELNFGINTGITDYFRLSCNYEVISDRYSNSRTSIERELKARWKIPEQDEYNIHFYTTPKLIKDYTLGIKIFNAGDENAYDDPTTVGSQEVQRENRTSLFYIKAKF